MIDLTASKIINGDCLEILKEIPDKSIDFICADLPYNIHNIKWDNAIDLELLWKEYKRIMKNDCAIALFASGMFVHKLAVSNEKMYKYDLIWKKSKCGSPFTAKYQFMKKHESILIFGKGRTKYNPQMIEGEPYKRNWTPNKKNNMKFGIAGVQTDNKGTRFPTSILDFPQNWRRQDQLHPTQKPKELMEYLVKTFSDDGDIILDNTAGSGSIADNNLNRKYILIDIEKENCEIMQKRLHIINESF